MTELFVGLFTARLGEAWSSLRALVGLLPRTPAILARRRAVGKLRRVDDAEVLGLLNRGSARLTRYRRAHDTETYIGADAVVRRWRESQLSTTIAWVLVVVFIIVASRTMIDRRVPSSASSSRCRRARGTGGRTSRRRGAPAASARRRRNPTGWGVLSIASVLWLWRMGLGLTVIVVGLVLLGVWGTWRLATVFPTNRARIAALVVYAALPLVPGVDLDRSAVGPRRLRRRAVVRAPAAHGRRHRHGRPVGGRRRTSSRACSTCGAASGSGAPRCATLATAVAVAIAPAVLPVLVVVAVILAVTTLAVNAGVAHGGVAGGLGLVACAAAFVLNLPWSTTWSWDELVAPTLAGAPGRGLVEVASMAIGRSRFEVLALALYVPVLVALLVARAWRLTWAARAAGLVVVFLRLAILQDRDALPFRVPEVGVLLAPVGLGLAHRRGVVASRRSARTSPGARSGGASRSASLGVAAVVVGVGAGAVRRSPTARGTRRGRRLGRGGRGAAARGDRAVADGSRPVGDYRMLYLGDPRLIPFPSQRPRRRRRHGGRRRRPGRPARPLGGPRPGGRRRALRAVVGQIAATGTRRAGRLLAPFGIRSIVVPVVDGATSTATSPLPVPDGLIDALGAQLDLARGRTPPTLIRFDNTAYIPTTASLTGAARRGVRGDRCRGGRRRRDRRRDTACSWASTARGTRPATCRPGVVHLGTPLDRGWELTVGGTAVDAATVVRRGDRVRRRDGGTR